MWLDSVCSAFGVYMVKRITPNTARWFFMGIALFVATGPNSSSLGGWGFSQPQPQQGLVAQLDVKGDLDARSLADDIVNWLAKRDPATEVLAVLTIESQRARPDLVVRIAESLKSCPVRVVVHLNARGPVEPQVLLIGFCGTRTTIARGVSVHGSHSTRLHDLIPAKPDDWKGQSEQLARMKLTGQDELLLDGFVPPLADVYLHQSGDSMILSRESISEKDVRIVDRINEDEWRVEIPHEVLVRLDLVAEADGLGQILRDSNVRAMRRVRTVVRSGLNDALIEIGALHEQLSTETVRLESRLKEVRAMKPHERPDPADRLRSRVDTAIDRMDDARRIFSRYPELYRMSPPWTFEPNLDADRAAQEWTRSFEALSDDLSELRRAVQVLERP